MLLNSTRSKTSGNICAATNSRSPSSTTTTTSLIKPATHGTSLSKIQCASRQSPPERGRLSMIRAVGITGKEIDWLPETMRILHDELSNIEVTVSSQNSPDLADALMRGRLDAAFVRL